MSTRCDGYGQDLAFRYIAGVLRPAADLGLRPADPVGKVRWTTDGTSTPQTTTSRGNHSMDINAFANYLRNDLHASPPLIDALMGNLEPSGFAVYHGPLRFGLDGTEAIWTRELPSGAMTVLTLCVEDWEYIGAHSKQTSERHDDDTTETEWETKDSDKRTVWLSVALAPRSGAHLDKAHARAKAALEARSSAELTAVSAYSGTARLMSEQEGKNWVVDQKSRERQVVWLSIEAGDARVPKGTSDEDALQAAAPTLRQQVDELLRMALCARGAIDGHAPELNKDCVTGFCGEYVARRSQHTLGLPWLGGYARFDFGDPGGRQVEVKSTRVAEQSSPHSGGLAHISPDQVSGALAKAQGEEALTWLQVYLPEDVVNDLFALLKEPPAKKSKGPSLPTDPGHPLRRLAGATGVPLTTVEANGDKIMSILGRLDSTEATILRGMETLQRDVEVLRQLSEVGAGLQVPFSTGA